MNSMNAAAFRAAQTLCKVESLLDEIREQVGVKDKETWRNMTIQEVKDAITRAAWCERHGSARCKDCLVCRALKVRGQ